MKPCYGITHEPGGAPRVLEPKTTKVGIGLAKGKALHTYIDMSGKWVVLVGKDAKRFDTKAEARKFYRETKPNAPERAYPQRLPYFTFSRISPSGDFEPDWDAIESHGPLPTEIEIVFTRDEPFAASYQMWTATEKKCEGDGINAQRVPSMAATDAEKALAAQAERNGEKTFPIVNGCWTRGCPYAKPNGDKPAPCRPHGRMLFQLLNAPRLGGTTYFDTTGYRSISQIFSCIETFKSVTGKGDAERGFVAGIPLVMVVRPYRTQHNGKVTTQYGVALEFRAENAFELKRQLIEHGVNFRLADAGLRQIAPAAEPIPVSPEDEDVPDENAAAICAEFQAPDTGDNGDDFGDPGAPAPLAMPRRKSEAAVSAGVPLQAQEASDIAVDLVGQEAQGDLDACWDTGAPAEAPQLPPQVEQAASPPPPAPRRAAGPKANPRQTEFYQTARNHGATDAVIAQALGAAGYERLTEVPDKAIPKLMEWARGY